MNLTNAWNRTWFTTFLFFDYNVLFWRLLNLLRLIWKRWTGDIILLKIRLKLVGRWWWRVHYEWKYIWLLVLKFVCVFKTPKRFNIEIVSFKDIWSIITKSALSKWIKCWNWHNWRHYLWWFLKSDIRYRFWCFD